MLGAQAAFEAASQINFECSDVCCQNSVFVFKIAEEVKYVLSSFPSI